MGIVKGLVDFAFFKEFVTPAFLKVLYLVLFVVMNLAGVIGIAFLFLTSILGSVAMVGGNDLTPIIISVVVALITAAVLVLVLILYNLLLRMYFEIILITFNIHGFLKSIDDKTPKGKK